MSDEYEFDAVDRITFGAIGPPGRRTFYLQARAGLESVTLLVEKDHVIALSEGTEEIFKSAGYPHESIEWDADSMALEEPVEPAFRVESDERRTPSDTLPNGQRYREGALELQSPRALRWHALAGASQRRVMICADRGVTRRYGRSPRAAVAAG